MLLSKKLTLLFIVLPFICFAQKSEIIEINKNYSVEKIIDKDFKSTTEYRSNIKKAVADDNLTYFGFDVSNLILSDSEKVGFEAKTAIYLKAWVDRFNKLVPYYDVRKMLKRGKKDFDTSFNNVQSLYKLRTDKWISAMDFSLSINDIARIIESYQLDQKSGIGFVIIAENFNKRKHFSSAYFTFFDISNRQLLWTTRVQMDPTGFGWTDYWIRGIVDGFNIFKLNVYDKQRRIARHNDQ